MGAKNRLNILDFSGSQDPASIEIPECINFSCPRCGEPGADKGQCSIILVKVLAGTKTGLTAKLVADCRSCGYYGVDPAVG